jgi:AcrR family transcriptional regulator
VVQQPGAQKRRPQRRDQILAVSVELFRERGYHATGMDDIGAAAGITGPGIYRHFRKKEDILETLVRQRGEDALAKIERIAASDLAPADALAALVDGYVDEMVRNPSLAVVVMYERRTLSDDARAWVDRMERRNVEEWVRVVCRVRPELSEPEARLVVHAALSLGVAVCNYKSGLDDPSLSRLMRAMVTSAILGAAAVVPS